MTCFRCITFNVIQLKKLQCNETCNVSLNELENFLVKSVCFCISINTFINKYTRKGNFRKEYFETVKLKKQGKKKNNFVSRISHTYLVVTYYFKQFVFEVM